MKKIICLVLLLTTLCSCGGGREIKPQLTGISFTAEISYYNENYSLDGVISKNGEFVFEIKEPEELCDLRISLIDGQTRVDYKGLTYTPLEGTMPFAKVLSEFYSPMEEIIRDDSLLAKSDGIIKGEGFTLTVSPTGLPLKLEIPDERFEVKFLNVSICGD